MVTAKVIEVENPDIVNKIVEATNNQSHVSNEKFLSLKAKSKTVESYFSSWNEESVEDSKIYFERRDNQYAGHGINDTKIFDIRTVARAFSAMFWKFLILLPVTLRKYLSSLEICYLKIISMRLLTIQPHLLYINLTACLIVKNYQGILVSIAGTP